MKKAWLAGAIVFGILAVEGFLRSSYWVIIGWSTQFSPYFVFGTFFLPLVFAAAAYHAWQKAKATTKQP